MILQVNLVRTGQPPETAETIDYVNSMEEAVEAITDWLSSQFRSSAGIISGNYFEDFHWICVERGSEITISDAFGIIFGDLDCEVINGLLQVDSLGEIMARMLRVEYEHPVFTCDEVNSWIYVPNEDENADFVASFPFSEAISFVVVEVLS